MSEYICPVLYVCMQTYMYILIYTYLCFIRLRDTFSFKYIKMVTDIIFEVYVFIANKYNYMKNNSFDLSILRIFFEWTIMSRSFCNIKATFDALVSESFSVSFNFFSPMDAYVYAPSVSYWHRLWAYIHMRSAKVTRTMTHTHIYQFVNFFDFKSSIIIIIFIQDEYVCIP